MKTLAAYVGGSACAAATAVILGLFIGELTPAIAWVSLGVGLATGALFAKITRGPWLVLPRGPAQLAMTAVFALACWKAFFFLIHPAGDTLRVQSANNLGDLIKHINYIRHMAGGTFWPDNPLVAGGGIHYPVGVDLLNALLLLVGADLTRTLVWVALAGSICTLQGLLRWGGALAVAGLLFSGGLAGFAFFGHWEIVDYQAAVAWKNLFLSIFITQRGFLFALPAGLLLLVAWRERAAGRPPVLPFAAEVAVVAVLPLFHIHTFLFMYGLLAFRAMVGTQSIRRHALGVLAAAAVPAAAFLWLVTDGFAGAGHVRWLAGWLGEEDPVIFWLWNFGMFLPLLAWAAWAWREDACRRLEVWPCAVLFVLCAFVAFAPWPWDNTKLFLWAYLGALPALGDLLQRWHPGVRAACVCGLFFSGALSLAGGLKESGFVLGHRAEFDAVASAVRGVPREARFAAAPEYNHPLYFAGRKMAMGYDGHLYGHGLAYAGRSRDLTALMTGDPGWEEAMARLEVTHIFWGERETRKYGEAPRPWMASARKVMEGDWGELFQVVR